MRRHLTPELMDDPGIERTDHLRALAGLARLNRLARVDAVMWREILPLARRLRRPVTVLDVATGSGDLPMGLASRAARHGTGLELNACDTSPTALEAAGHRASEAGVRVRLRRVDAIAESLGGPFDVVTCSLFLHHLREADAIQLLGRMREATAELLLLSDLRRDPLGLAMAWGASRAVCRSKVVHVDAVKSVRAAFTPGEMLDLARAAGLNGASVSMHWPRRTLLRWTPN